MVRRFVRVLAIGTVLVLGSAPPARALVDMNGPWNIIGTDPIGSGSFQCTVDVTQTGGSVSVTGSGCYLLPPFTLPGTIDESTGVFNASGTISFSFCTTLSVFGTTNPTSTAFTGGYTCDFFSGNLDGSRCGNGELDAGEVCDDGARFPGDCCSTTCTHDATGTYCVDEGNPCTYDVCDGAGTCTHPIAAGVECLDDFNPCTDHICDGAGVCQLSYNADPCDDGNDCTTDDTCAGGSCSTGTCSPCCDPGAGCTPALASGCKEPLAPTGPLNYRGDELFQPELNSLVWKWSHGDATTLAELGDPSTATDYTLCIYRHTIPDIAEIGLVLSATAPAAAMCGSRPCWKAIPGKGFRYSSKLGDPDGLTKLQIRAGGPGKAKIGIKGKGFHLDFSPVVGPRPVIAQLVASNGSCWRAGYLDAQLDLVYLYGSGEGAVDFRAKKSSPSGAFLE